MEENNNIYTLVKLLKEYNIEIPKIQLNFKKYLPLLN